MIQTITSMSVNGWALFAGAAAAMMIGYLWYGPLFAGPWGRLSGWTAEKIKTLTPRSLGLQYGLTFVLALLLSGVTALALRLVGAQSLLDGLGVAVGLWLGYVVPSVGTIYLFERQALVLFWINAGYRLVTMLGMAAILSVWK